MSATADLILERRQARRRLAFWRILAILAFLTALVALIPQMQGSTNSDHVARVRIDGVILDDPNREKVLESLSENEHVKAVILQINSPGGTVAAAEEIYVDLRKAAEGRPVVAVMSEAAASGGYIAALSADHIFARGGTLTGSIGVLTEVPNIAGLMEKLGVGMTRVKSAPLKAEPSITSLPSEEALEAQRALIADTYAWFRGLVSERRKLEGEALDKVSDGRVFTGRQAVENGLIDALGGESNARDWLQAERGVSSDLPAVDYDWDESEVPWLKSFLGGRVASWFSPPAALPSGPRLYAVIQ